MADLQAAKIRVLAAREAANVSNDTTQPGEREAIAETEVLLTMVGGRVAHEADW